MNELETRYEVTRKDLAKEKALKYGAWTAPVLLSVVPALILFVAGFLLGTSPPLAATFFFFSLISLIAGFVLGLIVTGGILYYRSNWLAKVRERIAVDGIKAEEVDLVSARIDRRRKKIAQGNRRERLNAGGRFPRHIGGAADGDAHFESNENRTAAREKTAEQTQVSEIGKLFRFTGRTEI